MRANPRRDAIGLKLSTKVVIALYAVFAVFGVIDYAIQHHVILPSFQSLEEESARTDMERVTRALDRELTQLMTFSADWGNWIDTYKFMEDHNQDFIEINMNPSFLNSSGIELVAFLDREGRYAWRQGYDARIHEPLRYAFLDEDTLGTGHPFLASIAQGARNQGIVLTEHGPMLLTLAPILDGNGNGPHRGAVLMGRLLAGKRIAQLAEQAQVQLTLKVLGKPSPQQTTTPDGPVTTRIVRREHIQRGLPRGRGRLRQACPDAADRRAALDHGQGPGRDTVCALVAADRRRDRSHGPHPHHTPYDPRSRQPNDAARGAHRRA